MRRMWAVAMLLAFAAGCDDGGGGGDEPPAPDAAGGAPDGGAPDAAGDAAPETEASLTAEPAVVEFPLAAPGGRSEAEVTLTNTGEAPLDVVAFEGLAAPFSASRTPPVTIPPGASRTLVVTFAPDAAGVAEATVTFPTTPPTAAPVSVTLRATGGAPTATLDTPEVDFGDVEPGTPDADFIRFTNTSEALPLNIQRVDNLGDPFTVPAGQVPAVVAPGQTGQVLVQFEPAEAGDFERVVTVGTDAGDFQVTLRGRAVARGDLAVVAVEPAWAPVDEEVAVVVHGGPFERAPDAVRIGDRALTDVELVDAGRIRGTLRAGGAATGDGGDLLDVRVEVGAAFGVLTAGLVRTPPVAMGRALDAAALAGPIGPDGNPWRLEIDEIPAGTEATVAPGTVILADGRTLNVAGVLRAGGDTGRVVFSAAGRAAGAWGGLRFPANAAASELRRAVIEYAGAGETPSVETAQATSFEQVVVRQGAGEGVRVLSGGALLFVDGQLADLAGDAIALATAEAAVARLSGTRIRRAAWPLSGFPVQFGRLPLGAGNDWTENAHEGIGLAGEVTGAVTLTNQPAGIVYGVRGTILVVPGGALGLAAAAPLRIDGPIEVGGTLTLPPGLRARVANGGVIDVREGGTLIAQGAGGAPIVLAADPTVEEGAAAPGTWAGLRIEAGATAAIDHFTLRDGGADGPALRADVTLGAVTALTVADSADVGLSLGGDAALGGARLLRNAGGTRLTGGTGRIAGTTDGPVTVEGVACVAWDVSALLTAEGEPAAVVCE